MRAVDTALDATSSGTPVHCSVLALEPMQQGNWVTVRRLSRGSKHRSSILIKTSNRFSPLSDAPTEKPDESALVIGDSILRNLKIETSATIVHCLWEQNMQILKDSVDTLLIMYICCTSKKMMQEYKHNVKSFKLNGFP